jgi:enoyl-CoA hydratase
MTTITSSREGAVATVTIDKAAQGNLLTVEDLRDLTAAIRAAGTTDAKVIVLRTMGADFWRGRAPGATPPTAMKMRTDVCEPILDVYDAIAGVRQPPTTPGSSSRRCSATCRRRSRSPR